MSTVSLIKNTSPTVYLADISIWPKGKINDMLDANSAEIDGIGARLLYALQLVVGLIALPVLLISGALEAAFRTVICQLPEATAVLQFTGGVIISHFCLLPIVLTGTFATSALAQQLEDAMIPCTEALLQIASCGADLKENTSQHTKSL